MTNGKDRQDDAAAAGVSNENAGAGGQGTRQPHAAHHLARIPFTTLRKEVPADLHALYVHVDADQAVIPGLQMGVGALVVQQWDPTYAAAGWTLYGADLTLDMGHPFGALFYRNDVDERVLRIGVQWHPPVQRLEFPALHPSKPELSGDCTEAEVDAVVLDARSRIGALVAINAQIGSWVATEESEDAILAAAGLGLERLAEDDARLAHDA
ncbi:hypothetical protein DEJ01_09840 [Curtobacterium sp. MCLR17_040]|uniref:hypothetical protein n=1 Tax=Curtobacterium sp. MCLR17_040 TaxID=2175625 RepID=UPI000DA7573E|nr:hypothetical protein [Curtobacterium sp. MCLR17_040]PZF02818.1 hypothetical protein DEJ01_09840 [Curtobacterium sp. MCLR17_040]